MDKDIEFKYADFDESYIEKIMNLGQAWDSNDKEIIKFKKDIYEDLSGNIYCPYCRRVLKSKKEDQIDHIIHKASYGSFTFQPKNLVIACKRCNNNKSAKDVLKEAYRENVKSLHWSEYPSTEDYYDIIHPYFDVYSKYIEVENDIFYIIVDDNNPKGINTIQMMNLNNFDLLEERAIESQAVIGIISKYCRIPEADEAIIAWSELLMKKPVFQKKIFRILKSFEEWIKEENKNDINRAIKLTYEQYMSFKNIILNGHNKYEGKFPYNLRTDIKFIKLINNMKDNSIITEVIEQLENLYKLKGLNSKFEYILFLAVFLLIKRKEGKYNKTNITKYLLR